MGIDNQPLCVDGKCDPHLFGYVYQTFSNPIPPPYPADVMTERITFSFAGALKPGRYWLAGSTPRSSGYSFSFYGKNQLIHLYEVTLSPECYSPRAPIEACAIKKSEQTPDLGDSFFLEDYLLKNDATLVCQRLPSLCPGGKLIFGELELS